ncbi:MAG TPA: IS30 family transposase [Bradyrhizobium sp.]|jgi:IS30 family transposase|nr:IS30 family transposase [Bradyrhizobium sp.]
MGRCYGQLSLEERVEIYRLHAGGRSQNQIASALNRAPSTVSRELRRNSRPTKVWPGGYDPVRAQRLADRRRRWDGRFKLARQPDLRDRVGKSLAMGHSPEQIAGRLTLDHGRVIISHESIYRFIYHRTAQRDYWHQLLPRRKKTRGQHARSRGNLIKYRRSIAERPAEIEGRATPGHWEADFMLFAKCGQGLLVLHERQTRFNIVHRPTDRKAALTAKTIARQLGRLPKAIRKSISFDNGNEFAEHHRLHHSLGVQTFFCDPHSPWQKGGVENAIGRLRRFLPRKVDLNLVTAADLRRYVHRLNNTPRKCLDFKTPAEAFFKLNQTVALQT